MPLFVFTAGLFCNVNNPEKVRKRAVGFVLLYILMKGISLITRCILFGDTDFSMFREYGMPWFMLGMGAWTVMAYVTRDYNKTILLLMGLLTSCLIGYDYSVTTQFAAARIINFWPFFLIGTMCRKEVISDFAKKTNVKAGGAMVLVFITVIFLNLYDKILLFSPLLSGQNSYEKLGPELCSYGGIARLVLFSVTVLLSAAVLAVTPTKEFHISKYGQRTLGIYFTGMILYFIAAKWFPDLRLWQYMVLSIILIPIMGEKRLNNFLQGFVR